MCQGGGYMEGKQTRTELGWIGSGLQGARVEGNRYQEGVGVDWY